MEHTSMAIQFVERVMAISPRIPISHLLNDGTTFVSLLSGNLFASISNTYIAFKVVCFMFFFLNLENALCFILQYSFFVSHPEVNWAWCVWTGGTGINEACSPCFHVSRSTFLPPLVTLHIPDHHPCPKDTSGNNLQITHQGVFTGTQKV